MCGKAYEMRQSGRTHKEGIENNLTEFTLEKNGHFQQPNDDAALHCTDIMKVLGRPLEVTELGCGDGAALQKFIELGVETLGVDINEYKLSRADGSTVLSDMLEWVRKQPNNSVPNIFMHHSLEHIVDVEEFLDNVSRVLVPGGIFYCVVPAGDEPHSVHETAFDDVKEIAPKGLFERIARTQERYNEKEFLYVGVKSVGLKK